MGDQVVTGLSRGLAFLAITTSEMLLVECHSSNGRPRPFCVGFEHVRVNQSPPCVCACACVCYRVCVCVCRLSALHFAAFNAFMSLFSRRHNVELVASRGSRRLLRPAARARLSRQGRGPQVRR